MAKKKGLGKGLGTLFESDSVPEIIEETKDISETNINLIEPKFLKHFHAEAEKFIKENHLQITPEGKAILTHSGIFISDYIMRELMI